MMNTVSSTALRTPATQRLCISLCVAFISGAACGRGDAMPRPAASTSTAAVLFRENFEDGAFAARGWYDLPNGGLASVTANEHAPNSTRSLELRFRAGQASPAPAVSARHLFPETETVYLSYWVKYGDAWVGSGAAYHPHEFYILTNADGAFVGPAYTALTVYVEDNFQSAGGVPVLGIQDGRNVDVTRINQDLTNVTEQRAVAGCNGSFDTTQSACYREGSVYLNGKMWRPSDVVFSAAQGAGYKGNWRRVEVFLKLNSIANGKAQADGVAQTWVDGKLVIDRSGVVFRTAKNASLKFNQLSISPHMGNGSPRDQSMWIDDVVVATAREAR